MLKKHHKVSSNFIREEGDEISFLKRTHRLINNDRLTISTHHKHVEQLMHLTGVKPTSRPKKVPGHPLLDEKDDTEALNLEEASHFEVVLAFYCILQQIFHIVNTPSGGCLLVWLPRL